MLRLISVEKGKVGILRTYQHDRLGLFEVVTVWPNAGAAIIHLQTFKIRSVKKGSSTPIPRPAIDQGKANSRPRKVRS